MSLFHIATVKRWIDRTQVPVDKNTVKQLKCKLSGVQCDMNDLRNLSVRAGRSTNVFALRNLSVMWRSRIFGNR